MASHSTLHSPRQVEGKGVNKYPLNSFRFAKRCAFSRYFGSRVFVCCGKRERERERTREGESDCAVCGGSPPEVGLGRPPSPFPCPFRHGSSTRVARSGVAQPGNRTPAAGTKGRSERVVARCLVLESEKNPTQPTHTIALRWVLQLGVGGDVRNVALGKKLRQIVRFQ